MPATTIEAPTPKQNLKICKDNARMLANKRWAAYYQAKAEKADASHRASIALVTTDQGIESTVAREIDSNSAKVKAMLSHEAVSQAEKAQKVEPSVFKLVVDACDKLFGWSKQVGPSCLVTVGYMAELRPTQQHCGVAESDKTSITIDVEPKS